MAGVWQVQRKLDKDEHKVATSTDVWVDCYHDTCRGDKAKVKARLQYMRHEWPDCSYRMVKLGKA